MSVGWSSNLTGTENGMVEIDTNAAVVPLQVAIQAVRDTAAPATSPPPVATNVGAGGCSIAQGETLADPTLWLLLLLAIGVLWRRLAAR